MKREKQINVRVNDTEYEIWKEESEKRNQSIAQFIRESISLNVSYDSFQKSDHKVEKQLVELRNLIKEFQHDYNLEREMLLSQIATYNDPIQNKPLEDQIISLLKGRSFFLNTLSEFTNEKPQTVLAVLAYLKAEGKVTQDIEMRWKLVK